MDKIRKKKVNFPCHFPVIMIAEENLQRYERPENETGAARQNKYCNKMISNV